MKSGIRLCIAAIACAFAFSGIAPAQSDRTGGRAPSIPGLEVDPWVLEFGEVLDGEEPVEYVVLRNTGKNALTITQIYSGCGCAVPRMVFSDGVEVEISQKSLRGNVGVIEPGKEARIEVRFLTHGYEGKIRKHIRIESDHPQAPHFNIGVRASIKKAITLEPETVEFGEVVRGQRAEREVLLLSKGIGRFDVSGIENLPPYLTFEAETDPGVVAGRDKDCSVRLKFRLQGNYPLGESRLLPLVSIDHDRIKAVRVPVKMNVRPKVIFKAGETPVAGNLDLGVFPGKEGKALTVDVVNLVPGFPYNILSVNIEESRPGSFETELRTVEAGVRYKLEIRIKPGSSAGYIRGTVSVISDHPDMMQKKIRILGYAIGG